MKKRLSGVEKEIKSIFDTDDLYNNFQRHEKLKQEKKGLIENIWPELKNLNQN